MHHHEGHYHNEKRPSAEESSSNVILFYFFPSHRAHSLHRPKEKVNEAMRSSQSDDQEVKIFLSLLCYIIVRLCIYGNECGWLPVIMKQLCGIFKSKHRERERIPAFIRQIHPNLVSNNLSTRWGWCNFATPVSLNSILSVSYHSIPRVNFRKG
jgi:hypothetical protein